MTYKNSGRTVLSTLLDWSPFAKLRRLSQNHFSHEGMTTFGAVLYLGGILLVMVLFAWWLRALMWAFA